jgi:hypothetical protein
VYEFNIGMYYIHSVSMHKFGRSKEIIMNARKYMVEIERVLYIEFIVDT